LVVQAQNDFVNLRYLLDEIKLIVEEWPAEDWNDGLRRMNRERTKSCSLAANKE
jgi:hypothetical protein